MKKLRWVMVLGLLLPLVACAQVGGVRQEVEDKVKAGLDERDALARGELRYAIRKLCMANYNMLKELPVRQQEGVKLICDSGATGGETLLPTSAPSG